MPTFVVITSYQISTTPHPTLPPTALRFTPYCLAFSPLLPCDFPTTTLQFSDYYLAICRLLPCDLPTTTLRFSDYYLAFFRLLPCVLPSTALRFSDYYLTIFPLLPCIYHPFSFLIVLPHNQVIITPALFAISIRSQ